MLRIVPTPKLIWLTFAPTAYFDSSPVIIDEARLVTRLEVGVFDFELSVEGS